MQIQKKYFLYMPLLYCILFPQIIIYYVCCMNIPWILIYFLPLLFWLFHFILLAMCKHNLADKIQIETLTLWIGPEMKNNIYSFNIVRETILLISRF